MALSSAWGVVAEVGSYWQFVRRPPPPEAMGAPVDSIVNRKPTTGGPKSHPSTRS